MMEERLLLYCIRLSKVYVFNDSDLPKKQKEALDILQLLPRLLNQTTGDALSDLLFVDFVLSYKEWTLQDWHACYTELPSRLMKVVVSKRR